MPAFSVLVPSFTVGAGLTSLPVHDWFEIDHTVIPLAEMDLRAMDHVMSTGSVEPPAQAWFTSGIAVAVWLLTAAR